MTHEIFQDYFVDARARRPWHNLGHFAEEQELSATAAFDTYTPINITLEDMSFTFNGVAYPSEYKSVVRWPLPQPGLDLPVQLAVVGKNYTHMQPREVVEIIDAQINRTIETIGVLNDGTLFITIRLGDNFEVAGDEIERYLLLSAPCNGKDAYEVAVTHTRVVCNNTLVAGLKSASQRYSVRHDNNAKALFTGWMEHVWENATAAGIDISDAFNAMARRPVDATIADALIGRIIPMPKEPAFVPVAELRDQRYERYEQRIGRSQAMRDAIMDVWSGGKSYEKMHLGYEAKAWDSAWGLYNAANEVIEFGGSTTATKPAGPFFGKQKRKMEHVFNVCHNYAMTGEVRGAEHVDFDID